MERCVTVSPEKMQESCVELIQKSSMLANAINRENIGNVKHHDLIDLTELLQRALCAARAMENWRRQHPLEAHRENE